MNRTLARWAFAACLLMWGVFFATASFAQLACAPYSSVVVKLDQDFGEERQGGGLGGRFVFEVWASPETGTWTLLRLDPNGLACVMATGDEWEHHPHQATGTPA